MSQKGTGDTWNASLYQQSHGFVWQFGRDVLGLLSPRPGERILDIGCGTGQLTADIAQAGAEVLGVDRSPAMIVQAQNNFPGLRFEVHDVCSLPFHQEFDAVFSNAALHWVPDAETAAAGIARALKSGGRFVAELGGHSNIATLMSAADRAWLSLDAGPVPQHPWFYPTVGQYASLLERQGLSVEFATLFDRPTPLENGSDGLARWYRMFGSHWVTPLSPAQLTEFNRLTAEYAAPRLLREGQWQADYRRLRITAVKP